MNCGFVEVIITPISNQPTLILSDFYIDGNEEIRQQTKLVLTMDPDFKLINARNFIQIDPVTTILLI